MFFKLYPESAPEPLQRTFGIAIAIPAGISKLRLLGIAIAIPTGMNWPAAGGKIWIYETSLCGFPNRKMHSWCSQIEKKSLRRAMSSKSRLRRATSNDLTSCPAHTFALHNSGQ